MLNTESRQKFLNSAHQGKKKKPESQKLAVLAAMPGVQVYISAYSSTLRRDPPSQITAFWNSFPTGGTGELPR